MFPKPIAAEGMDNCLVVNLEKLPEARIWQVGQKYQLVVEVKMEAIDRNRAMFEVSGASPKEEESLLDDDRPVDTTEGGGEPTVGNFASYGGG